MLGDKVIDKSGWNYTIIDNAIIETDKLDIFEKMLYIALKRFANIQTGEAFPGVKKIAQYAGMSHRKARDVIASMEEKKILQVERRANNTSLYTLLNPALLMHDMHEGHAHGARGVMHDMHEGHAHGAHELKKDNYKKIELQDKVACAPSCHKYEICDMENAQLLLKLMKDNNPDLREPKLEKWANEFRLIRERDKRTQEQIVHLIKWTQNDSFWRGNILSPSKLREKWDMLVLRVKEEHSQKKADKQRRTIDWEAVKKGVEGNEYR